MRRWAAGLILGVCLIAGDAVGETVSVAISSPPNLGKVVRGASSTVFTISSAGAVSKIGPAVRITSGSLTPMTVTIACSGSGHCNSKAINVTISATAPTPARFSKFTVSNLHCVTGCSSISFSAGPSTSGSTTTFSVNGIGNATFGFTLSDDVTLDAGASSGVKTFPVTVRADLL